MRSSALHADFRLMRRIHRLKSSSAGVVLGHIQPYLHSIRPTRTRTHGMTTQMQARTSCMTQLMTPRVHEATKLLDLRILHTPSSRLLAIGQADLQRKRTMPTRAGKARLTMKVEGHLVGDATLSKQRILTVVSRRPCSERICGTASASL